LLSAGFPGGDDPFKPISKMKNPASIRGESSDAPPIQLLLLLLLAAAGIANPVAAQDDQLFEMRIRPLLVEKCYACHTEERMGGLQLDTREHAMKGGKDGPVILPGDPEKSLLVKAIRYSDVRLKMPPTGKLKDDQIATIEAWIKAGAVWPDGPKSTATSAAYRITPEQRAFWSFRPIQNPAVPVVRDTKWAKSDIDRFILAKLQEQGLTPSAPADKRTLIRRATFDLTGLPPTSTELSAVEQDFSPDAFAKVIDRLLASPRYGERWGRIWLDVARYSDDKLNSERDEPYENSFRYRDWVIQAVEEDMPYNTFVKAQIAGDLMPDHGRYEAGLGFYALSPEFQDDRVDATTRGFLGLTVACAQCHNHKYDPIPTQDYYSLLGIFENTSLHEIPLAPKSVVDTYAEHKKRLEEQQSAVKDFISNQGEELAGILASQTSAYLLAIGSQTGLATPDRELADIAAKRQLDAETLVRWSKYLAKPKMRHPYLENWYKACKQLENSAALNQTAKEFETLVLAVNKEKKRTDDENHVRLGLNPSREDLSRANLVSMARDRYVLWEDLFGEKGVYHYGDPQIDRFLTGVWKTHLDSMRKQVAALEKEMPPQYPYLQTIADNAKLSAQHVWVRGNKDNPGELAPPHFLSILSDGEPKRFTKGSGRVELADAIIDPKNPLTARVIVNRVWQQHFGKGLVRTPSNFGKQGDQPSHPALLDYLASRFMADGWSLKKLHRQIMLSSVYALSAASSDKNYAVDPDNRLLWHANRRRLDAESLRDSLLFVSGKLDTKMGGPAVAFTTDNYRRTVYGYVSRRRLDPFLALFDFPNPVATSEQRLPTTVPLQALFFMNSDLMMSSSKSLADRVTTTSVDDSGRIEKAYELLFQRKPTPQEQALGRKFVTGEQGSWPRYAQVLLSSSEFAYLN
jgi:hypothetical protein